MTDRTRASTLGTGTQKRWVAATFTLSLLLALSWILPIGTADAANPADTLIDSPTTEQMLPSSFADLVAAVKPAVVNISASRRVTVPGYTQTPGTPMPGSPFDELFRRFFDGRRGGQLPPGVAPREPRPGDAPLQQSMGSGFIVDPEGWVVTNNHVIDGAEQVTVTLDDGRQFEATLRGTDPKTDLALLRVETDEELPWVRFGDSESARAGDWVLAIGNPFGLGGTATLGIVSARGRDIQAGPYDDFLQVDAPINRGNSGGPLFDASGRVIGVNTAIFSPNGGNVGIGFAIPSSQATPVIEQLRESGRVERGWLGVQIQAIDDELAEGLGLDSAQGALVAEVVAGSPAQEAGLRAGDVIIGLDGGTVERFKDLTRGVAEAGPGDEVELDVWRDGERETVAVTLGRLDQEETVLAESTPAEQADEATLGLTLADLTPETRQRYRIAPEVDGVLVVDVAPRSPAAERSLRPGDVILMVGQRPVADVADVEREVESSTEDGRSQIVLQVARGSSRSFVPVPIA